MIFLIVLLFTILGIKSVPLKYGFSNGILTYSETSLNQTVEVPHFQNPMILYSLTSVNINSFFSYLSRYTIVDNEDKGRLTIFVEVDGVTIFNLGLSYIYMQSMPNLETTFLNLTYETPQKIFNSKKNLFFDEDTYVSAHLVGFSSSNFTKDNFFYAVKHNITYVVYTNTKLRENDWISLNFVILQSNYNFNNTICIGSYINVQSDVTSSRSPLKIQIQPQLNFIIGIQAIHLANAQFEFNKSTNTIIMKGVGAYSFSVMVINNTCNYVFDYQLYQQTKQEKIYLGLMITFIVLFFILAAAMTICFLKKKYEKKIRIPVVENNNQQRNIRSTEPRRSSNEKTHNRHSSRSLNRQKSPRKIRQSQNQEAKSSFKSQKSHYLRQELATTNNNIDYGDEAPGTEVRLTQGRNQIICLDCGCSSGNEKQCNNCNLMSKSNR